MTKRKSTPKKATKTKESYFDAERILDERKVSGKWQYLIKWSGHDRNGKPWSPDWQPKDNCTQMLLKEWEQEKLRQRKRQEEQKNKENRENDNREDSIQEENIKQEDHSMDLQDDKADNKLQMDIDKPDHKITDDKMQQVLDKYCQNINDDIKKKTQSLGPITVKRDMNPSRKFIKSLKYPMSKVKLIKISPIQPTFANNLPIKSSISILEPANNICGKKFSIPSKSERVSLFNLNKRSLEDHNNNNSIITKRLKTEDVYDVSRKNNQSKANGKVEDSRISASSSNVKNRKTHSQTNESSNRISSDGNLINSQSISTYNVPSTQHIGAIHVNSETIKALNSRKNSYSSLAPKFRPIAAKVTPSQSQYNNATSSSNSSNAVNVYSSGTGKWSGNNSSASSSRQNSSTNKLASIRNPVSADNLPKSGVSSSSSQTDKDVPISTSAQHTSYFHKSYVQSTSVPKTVSNNVTKSNQSVDNHINQTMTSSQKASTSNKQSIISSTNEQSNHQQSSNLQNSSIGTSSMENNNNDDSHNQPLSQLSLEKLKEPTVENIDFLMCELTKAKSLNETLEKEKLDLIKEKNRYCKEANQLKLEVERRPQSDSETTETIKKCQENITKMYNKWMDSQNKFETKCNDYTKLELEHSKLQSEHNQVKKIVMTKHSEVETLKGELNEKIQEFKDLGEENNRLKADWVKNGVILMREDYHKITKLQNSLQDLINQRNSFNAEINRWRETISKEINDMRNVNYEDDDEEYDNLYLQIENLKLQNKLQETSLRMAEENSKMAEESTKLMFDLKKLTIEEILKKYDVPSFPNSQASSSSSSTFANLLTKNSNNSTSSNNNIVNQSRQSQNNNQGGNTRRMSGSAEIRSTQNNSVQGHVNTNTNILQARNLTTALAVRNFSSNSARNLNTSRISTAVVRENTNSRTLSSTTSPTGIIPNRGAALPLGVRRSSIVTTIPIDMNVRPSISTTEKPKVIRVPNPKSPTKSIQQMNYFCEWNFCRRSFDDKIELKKHIKENHFNFG